jgi:hypothetical protein
MRRDLDFGWFVSADNVLTAAMDATQLHRWLHEQGIELPPPRCGMHGIRTLYSKREVKKWLAESSIAPRQRRLLAGSASG